MFGDRIILPSRNTGRHGSWCVSLVRIRCLLPTTKPAPEPDIAELAILQLLREGYTARDIGVRIGLSPRTVEHKLEKLKAAFGARSVAHLATLSIVSAIGPR
ncbi:Bacterial regulatory protein, luxR family [compost metagenome]